MVLVVCVQVKKIMLASETSLKTGFSAFALLQSKWCMPVGVAGLHVCVHQPSRCKTYA